MKAGRWCRPCMFDTKLVARGFWEQEKRWKSRTQADRPASRQVEERDQMTPVTMSAFLFSCIRVASLCLVALRVFLVGHPGPYLSFFLLRRSPTLTQVQIGME